MELTRKLVRYAIPGGYAALICVVLEGLFGWAWQRPADEIIGTAGVTVIATIGGAIVIGFIHHQIYVAFYGSGIDHALSKPRRWMPAVLRVRLRHPRTHDFAGFVLEGMMEITGARLALERAYELRHGIAPCVAPRKASVFERARYAETLTERECALHSLLAMLADCGERQMLADYREQADDYHLLGVCRVTLVSIVLAAIVDVLAKHQQAFAAHLQRSVGVSVLSLLMFCGGWLVMSVNRRRIWLKMALQLRNGLRCWALRNPLALAEMAAENRVVEPLVTASHSRPQPPSSPQQPHRARRPA